MKNLQQVNIDQLQPTDLNLVPETMSYYRATYPIFRDKSPPSVWLLDGTMYIADGHNDIRDRYDRGRKNITANLLTPENCGVGPGAYWAVVSEVLEKAEKARTEGIRHISDLKEAA